MNQSKKRTQTPLYWDVCKQNIKDEMSNLLKMTDTPEEVADEVKQMIVEWLAAEQLCPNCNQPKRVCNGYIRK